MAANLTKNFDARNVTVAEDVILPDFKYTDHIICSPEVKNVDFSISMYPGCHCNGNCDENVCPCIVRYGINYDNKGHLLKLDDQQSVYSSPIFECNGSCNCPNSCNNRLSQKHLQIRLQIFHTMDRGLGVRSLQAISKGRFICEYPGEIVSYEEAKKRTAQLGKTQSNYMLVLKEHIAEHKILKTHVDATLHGNVARFINHSCNHNMELHPVRINTPVPRICLFAARDIKSGEELTFSYGTNGRQASTKDNCSLIMTKCLCAEDCCLGYLPFDECLYEF